MTTIDEELDYMITAYAKSCFGDINAWKDEKFKQAIQQLVEGAVQNPWDFVQPCEPDCTPERHAYHQGQWDMAQRMSGSNFPTDGEGEE